MANYTALEAYSLFTPPSNQLLFQAQIPAHLQEVPRPVASSPAEVITVQSVSDEGGVPYDGYDVSDEKEKEENTPSDTLSETVIKIHSKSPAVSQLYAMKRR